MANCHIVAINCNSRKGEAAYSVNINNVAITLQQRCAGCYHRGIVRLASQFYKHPIDDRILSCHTKYSSTVSNLLELSMACILRRQLSVLSSDIYVGSSKLVRISYGYV